MTTFEQTIKQSLPIGSHCVTLLQSTGSTRIARIVITPRGVVRLMARPRNSLSRGLWFRVKGEALESKGMGCIVFGARDQSLFDEMLGNPTATVHVQYKGSDQ